MHPPPGNSFCFFLSTTSFSVPLFNNFDILAFTYSLLHPRREKRHPWLKTVKCYSPSVYRNLTQVALVVKNLPANVGDLRDADWIPDSGRSPGGGHGNPLQYYFLDNSHGQRNMVGFSPWGHKELDTTEVTWHTHTQLSSNFLNHSSLVITVTKCALCLFHLCVCCRLWKSGSFTAHQNIGFTKENI